MTFWPLWPQMTPDEFLQGNFVAGVKLMHVHESCDHTL